MSKDLSIAQLIEQQEELEPETLKDLFPNLSSKDRQKLLALRLLRHTRAPYEDFYVFENVCHVINDIEPSVDRSEGCSPGQIWYIFNVIRRLFDGSVPDLADEIKEYIRFCHKDNGLQFYPPNIGMENSKLEEVKDKAGKGPFPLTEEPLDLQAMHYLKIQRYLESKDNA